MKTKKKVGHLRSIPLGSVDFAYDTLRNGIGGADDALSNGGGQHRPAGTRERCSVR